MALLDSYCTIDDYRLRFGSLGTGVDATLTDQLKGVTRLLERALRVPPGAFNSSTGTIVFDGSGRQTLWLRDDMGQYFLQDVDADGISIDEDGDGDYEYTLDFADDWVIGLPRNAATLGEPYDRLEFQPTLADASLAIWPHLQHNIAIAGTWGWSAVPEVIIDLVAHRTNDLREALKGGITQTLPSFESGGVPMSRTTAYLWKEAEQLYGFGGLPRVVR